MLLVNMGNFRFIYALQSILGIAPFFSFERGALLSPRLNRVYAVTVALLFLSVRLFYYYQDMRALQKDWNFTRALLAALDELLLVLMYCFQLSSSCIFKQEVWLKMNNTLLFLDAALNKTNKPRRRRTLLRHAAFLAYHTLTFSTVLYMVVRAPLTIFFRYVLYQSTLYPSFLITLTIQNLSLSFALRYEQLNCLLLESFRFHQNQSASAAKNWKLLQYYSRVLQGTVCCFNEIFGYPLLLVIAKFVVFSLRKLEVFIYKMDRSESKISVAKFFPASAAVTIVVSLACTVVMVMSCDALRAAQQRTRRICNRLVERFEALPELKLELQELSRFLRDNPARFTAADFFDVDRTTIFGMFAIIATYLIVILQFNRVD